MIRRASSILVATLLAVSVITSYAQADAPAAPGTRRVPFEIRVEGLAAFPEMMVVVYPYSLSNGAPTHEHAVLREGEPLPLGRRSGPPKLWAVRKADYEAFAATYTPTRSFQDAPLDAFFKSGKARECNATVEPVFELPFADPRAAAVQSFHADAIDATQCRFTAAEAPHPAKADTGERAEQVAIPPDAPREATPRALLRRRAVGVRVARWRARSTTGGRSPLARRAWSASSSRAGDACAAGLELHGGG